MLILTHLIVAIAAAVAIASPDELTVSQVLFSEPSVTAAADPPVKTPKTNTVFRGYYGPRFDCDTVSFNAEYDLRPGVCYSLPLAIRRGELLFYDCGQGGFRPITSLLFYA